MINPNKFHLIKLLILTFFFYILKSLIIFAPPNFSPSCTLGAVFPISQYNCSYKLLQYTSVNIRVIQIHQRKRKSNLIHQNVKFHYHLTLAMLIFMPASCHNLFHYIRTSSYAAVWPYRSVDFRHFNKVRNVIFIDTGLQMNIFLHFSAFKISFIPWHFTPSIICHHQWQGCDDTFSP